MNSVSGTCGRSIHPIAIAMDQAVAKKKQAKLKSQSQIIVDYVLSNEKPKIQRSGVLCKMDNKEARALQRLFHDK